MSSPTPTQRTVMEAMRDGARLCHRTTPLGTEWYLRPSYEFLSARTANALCRGGWVASTGTDTPGGAETITHYRLTTSGLDALAAKQEPDHG